MRSLQNKPPHKKFGSLTIKKGALMRPQLRTPGQIGKGKRVGVGISSGGPYPGAKYLGKQKAKNATQSALQNRLETSQNNPTGREDRSGFEKHVKTIQAEAKGTLGKKAIRRKGGLRQAAMEAVKKKLESMGE